MGLIKKLKALIINARKIERVKDIEIHEQKIYHAFYNHNINLTDNEIAESLERVAKRLKMDLNNRKDERQRQHLDSEKAHDTVKAINLMNLI